MHNMAHIHHGIQLSHEKNEIMPFAVTGMELEATILNKVTQERKITYHVFSLISES